MARKSKHEQLEAHLEAVKRLRQEVAEQERKARRRRHDALAGALTALGLDEALLALSETDRQRIGALGTVSERLSAWARCAEQPERPGGYREPAGAGEALETHETEERRAGFFGGR